MKNCLKARLLASLMSCVPFLAIGAGAAEEEEYWVKTNLVKPDMSKGKTRGYKESVDLKTIKRNDSVVEYNFKLEIQDQYGRKVYEYSQLQTFDCSSKQMLVKGVWKSPVKDWIGEKSADFVCSF